MSNQIDIRDEVGQNFIDFSYEANSARAFADARDGLKPGQRACLWEMFNSGYLASKPHVKSAKISGTVAAHWWPHGTTAIYESFTRMSQDWINNCPEVDWHGNNGSVIMGPDPASERYTEARLSKLAELGLFGGIKKKNVPMIANFSEDAEWPEVLPAVLPRLLVNGCQGIGSTIANTWLPHSLDDIAAVILNYIDTGKLDYSNLYPSFPSGGTIINASDVSKIYETGKGKVILRGTTEIVGNKIKITELPYQVYVQPYTEAVIQMAVDGTLTGIDAVYNKSGKNKLLIEVECSGSPAQVLAQLYAKTDLQKNYNANQWALIGKTPKMLTLKDYIDVYCKHNIECIVNEAKFDYNNSIARKEIVDGLLKALEDIDNIINLIKKSVSSTDAKENLIKVYNFTENQAKAIVAMRLGSLANMEKIELQNELAELNAAIEKLGVLINSETEQKIVLKNRLSDLVNKFGKSKAKTQVTQVEVEKVGGKEKPIIVAEDCIVTVFDNGNVRRAAVPKTNKRNTVGTKIKDGIVYTCKSTTLNNLYVFSSKGKMYRVLINDIPDTERGSNLAALVKMESGEHALTYATEDADKKYIFFITKAGTAKKVPVAEFLDMKRSGVIATKFKDGDTLATVVAANDGPISIVTKQGFCSTFDLTEMTASSRTAVGMKGIKLGDGDEVVAAVPNEGSGNLVVVSADGCGKRIDEKPPVMGRGTKGVSISKTPLGGATWITPEQSVMVVGNRSSVCVAAKDIPIQSRTCQGVKIIKNNNSVNLVVRV